MGSLRARAGDRSTLMRANPIVFDGAFAACWGVLGVLHLLFPDAGWEEAPVAPYRAANVAIWVLMLLVCAPIAWRRAYPLYAFVVSFSAVWLRTVKPSLAPSVTRRLIAEFAKKPMLDPARQQALATVTERKVLLAVARGQSNADIATSLFMGAGTVKTHVSHLLTKLGVRDRAQLVVFAYESGLILSGRAQEVRR